MWCVKKISSKMEVTPPKNCLNRFHCFHCFTLLTLLTQWHMPIYIATWLRLWLYGLWSKKRDGLHTLFTAMYTRASAVLKIGANRPI